MKWISSTQSQPKKMIETRMGPGFVRGGLVTPSSSLYDLVLQSSTCFQVFMSICWTYCQFESSRLLCQLDGPLYKGDFESCSSNPCPHRSPSLFTLDSSPNGTLSNDLVLSIECASNNVTKRFRRACLQPQRSMFHEISLVSSYLASNEFESVVLHGKMSFK